MTRDKYILAVKAKLDEISPFDEPGSFIASGDPSADEVKPIISYIESELDNAVEFCMNNLPLSLFAKDVTEDEYDIALDISRVGHIEGIDKYMRIVRVCAPTWQRDVTAFITSSSPSYLLQQKLWTRGGVSKPVVAWIPEKNELELFSFPLSGAIPSPLNAKVYYINTKKKAGEYPTDGSNKSLFVKSPIEDFIVIRCAALVMEILGSDPSVIIEEYTNKLNDILK